MKKTLFTLLSLFASISSLAYNVDYYSKEDIIKIGELEYTIYFSGPLDRDHPEGPSYAILSDAKEFAGEELLIPNLIEWNGKNIEVIGVKEYAAKDNQNIKRLLLTGCFGGPYFEIQKRAFEDCKHLKEIVITYYAYVYSEAFKGCSSLESIDCGEGIPSVFNSSFSGINSKSLTIINGDLHYNNFNDCDIETIYLENCDVSTKGVYDFRGTSIILKSCNLGNDAIISCSFLEDVTFDGCSFSEKPSLTSCSRLNKVTFANSIKRGNNTTGIYIDSCPSIQEINFYNCFDGGEILTAEHTASMANIILSLETKDFSKFLQVRATEANVYLEENEEAIHETAPVPKWKFAVYNETVENVNVDNPYAVVSYIDFERSSNLKDVKQSSGFISGKMFRNFSVNPFDIFHCGDIYNIGSQAFMNCSALGDTFTLPCATDENGCDIWGEIFFNSPVKEVAISGNVRLHNGTFGKLDKVYIGESKYPLPLIGMEGDITGAFSGCEIKELFIDRELTTTSSEGCDKKMHAFADAKVGTLILKGLTEIPANALIDGEFNIVDIASTVERIEAGNLEGTKSINIVISRSTVPPVLRMEAYAGIAPDIRIVVPEESIEAYKTAEGWRDFSRFEALKTVGIDEVADDLADEPVEIYTLDGRRGGGSSVTLMSGATDALAPGFPNLAPGIYIVRTASGKTSKIAVP